MSATDRWLVLGPLANEGGLEGGLTVSFSLFIEELNSNNIDYKVINTNKSNYKYKGIALFKIYWLFFKKVGKCSHISLHGSDKDYIYLAPIVVFFSNFFGKTVSLRKFAGRFREDYKNLNILKKFFVRYALSNSNINFFQTKYLIKYFKPYNDNTFWFPTVRTKAKFTIEKEKVYNKRFIFLGHIHSEKGIDEILKAANILDNSYHIDLYGSITENKYNNTIWKEYKNITYKGILPSDDVLKTLNMYDVLILPSYREGYPGVITEAFSVGVPVIATKLEGIMEMVNEDSGILIDVKSVEQLKKAILFFNDENHTRFSKSALKNFESFDAEIKIKEIIEQIKLYSSN